MTNHYDVIVIGSGAGGGTLTYALAPTGKRILLLERGDFLPREPQNWDSKSVWVDLRYHNSGNWTDADTGEEFPPKQNYYVGGNTKVYGAILFRFRERDFRQIQHVDGVSPAWPLTYADFEPWYTRAEHFYHVRGQRGADPVEPPSAAPYRYPPLSHEPRIAQLEADFTQAGLHPFPLPVGLIYDESAPQFSPCIRCATCDGYPCLVNGKAASLGLVVPVLKDAGQLHSEVGQTALAAASIADFAAIVLLSLFFSSSSGSTGARVVVLGAFAGLVAVTGIVVSGAARSARLGQVLVRLQDTTAEIRVRFAVLLLVAFTVLAERFGLESILGAFLGCCAGTGRSRPRSRTWRRLYRNPT
jgi:choline dehydrogenase-like flavoprotein